MSPDREARIAALFLAARDMAPDDRREFLDRECSGDESARVEVLDLVAQDDQAVRDGFLTPETRGDGSSRPSGPTASGPPRYYQVDLFRGSGLRQTVDLQELLRVRLRVALAIATISNAAIFALNLFDGTFARPGVLSIFLVHLGIILTSGVSVSLLSPGRALSVRALRGVEIVNLLAIAAFFTLFQVGEFHSDQWWHIHVAFPDSWVIEQVRDECVLRWLTLQVAYALYFPNTVRRCAIVIACLAVCPLVIAAGVGLREGTLGIIAGCLPEMAIWMAMGSTIAIYGSRRLNQLRDEAIEARKVGPYDLKRKLGAGGMGEVYLAEHARLRRPCAIKLIRPEQAGDVATIQRFEREVQVTATLMHPNTVRVFDYGISEDGTFYCTMEYLPGTTLQHLVDEHGPLPPGRAVHLLRQVCQALREAHGLGLVHRDIKPGNIMVSRLGGIPDFVKLLDFGLAQSVSGRRSRDARSGVGSIAGTPGYLSPEQAEGRDDLDARSDIYSLGLVGHFLLTGQSAFSGTTPIDLLLANRDETTRPPSASGGAIPADLDRAIGRCLRKERDDRFPDIASLAEALGSTACAVEWTEAEADRWWRDHPVEDASIPLDLRSIGG